MDSKTLPKGCNPGKGCFNCPYPDCINPNGSQLSEEEKAMLECGSPISKAQEYQRAYRQQHRQEIREYDRAYRQQHRQEIREYNRAYYQQHRQEVLEYQQEYRQRHRQELLEYQRAYYREHRQETLGARRKRRQEILDE